MSTYETLAEALMAHQFGTQYPLLRQVQLGLKQKYQITTRVDDIAQIFSLQENLVLDKMEQHGYIVEGTWEDNAIFWDGIITRDQFLSAIAQNTLIESHKISDSDIRKWYREIKFRATRLGFNMNRKHAFENAAYDILDNDPKLDAIGNNDDVKYEVVNDLWSLHKRIISRKKLNRLAKRAHEENEEQHQYMVNRAIIQRQHPHDQHHIEYFSGISNDGSLRWLPDPQRATAYKTQQRAEEVLNSMIVRDLSKYPNGKQGRIAGEQPYQFSIAHIQKPSQYEEDEEDVKPRLSSINDDRTKTELFKKAYEQGKMAAKADYQAVRGGINSRNRYAPGSFRHDAWEKGYADGEAAHWSPHNI